MILLLFAACFQTPESNAPQVSFETGGVANCLASRDAEVCYAAAVANPDHPKLDLLLGPPCRARVLDSCRLYFDVAQRMGQARNASTAMRIGCETGDDYLCAKYLEEAAATADEDQRAWIIDFVQESRRKHTEAKR
jgi:hypothetical protein